MKEAINENYRFSVIMNSSDFIASIKFYSKFNGDFQIFYRNFLQKVFYQENLKN